MYLNKLPPFAISPILKIWRHKNFRFIRLILNISVATFNPGKYFNSRAAWKKTRAKFAKIGQENEKIIFTNFLFAENVDISIFQAIAILSMKSKTHGIPIYVFHIYDCDGPLWKLIKENVNVVKINNFTFRGVGRYRHFAHKGDIVRLEVLSAIGGLYFDIDTITVNSPEKLFDDSRLIMGYELSPRSGEIVGLCNAIMSAPRGNEFIRVWMKQTKYFWSSGKDVFYAEFAVALPLALSRRRRLAKYLIALPSEDLFKFLFTEIEFELFREMTDQQFDLSVYPPIIHLWESQTQNILNRVDAQFIFDSSSFYAQIARRTLIDLNIQLDQI